MKKKYSYDHNLKALFSHPVLIRELVEFIQPELAEKLDWETMKPPDIEKSYLTEDLKSFSQDLLAEIPLKNEKGNIYLILLIEFQSRPERFMPLRVMNYLCLFWLDWLKNQEKQPQYLPPAFPVVFYNGKQKWNYPNNIKELIYPLKDSNQFIPDFEFYPFYLNRLEMDKINTLRNALSAVLQIEKAINFPEFMKVLGESGISLDKENNEVIKLIRLWFSRLVEGKRISNRDLSRIDKIEDRKEDKTMITEVLNQYYEETIQKGILQGKQLGFSEGEFKAKLETANNLLKEGVNIDIIQKATGLSPEQLKQL